MAMQKRLGEESDRSLTYLAASTRRPLITCVEQQLIGRHLESILENGYAELVKEHRVADLAKLYTLAARVDRLQDLRQAFSTNIRKVGEALVMDPEKVITPLPKE